MSVTKKCGDGWRRGVLELLRVLVFVPDCDWCARTHAERLRVWDVPAAAAPWAGSDGAVQSAGVGQTEAAGRGLDSLDWVRFSDDTDDGEAEAAGAAQAGADWYT